VWLQAHSDDWNAIADISKIEATLKHIISIDPDYDNGNPQMMLGALASQIPPSLGGKPEIAEAYFQDALKLSDNKNLMAQVYYAKFYARLVFNQQLHDHLLREALKANPKARDFTLSNLLAQEMAVDLLVSSQDYF
ncbi:MAG: TRAP transporter TatT component family protein, partial [Salinisphaeraceae bacterium]|nr:TRAP transporter TatT component family protein [Salinisphaeraceae bacterium]